MNNKYSKQKSTLCITLETNLSANLYFLQQEVITYLKLTVLSKMLTFYNNIQVFEPGSFRINTKCTTPLATTLVSHNDLLG